jgi:uncharacterized protein involved in exopolysaccharide biosynthesis
LPAPSPVLDLRFFFRAVRENAFAVAATTLAAALLTFGITFLLPKWYRAQAVILPPEESDLISSMSMAQRSLSKFATFGVFGDYFTPADIYKAVLKSRTVQELVVERFGLAGIYHTKGRDKTLKALRSHYDVRLSADGTIAVSVEDRDPKRAADMAMTFIEGLDRYNIEKRNSQARRTRMFLEQRVFDTDSLLKSSEVALRQYQEQHSTVAPSAASGSSLDAAADLMAKKIMLEVRLGVLRSYLQPDNEQVVQAQLELDQLKQRIEVLPALQTELQRLIRDAKVQEQLYLLLTAELEQARIRETMDTPTVQVLDRAVPPERQSRPRRMLLTAAAGLIAFAGCVVWLALRGSPSPSEA